MLVEGHCAWAGPGLLRWIISGARRTFRCGGCWLRGFVGIIVLVTLLRAERIRRQRRACGHHVALGRGRWAAIFRGQGSGDGRHRRRCVRSNRDPPSPQLSGLTSGPARPFTACERALFGLAELAAAAVAYAASQVTLLTTLGDVATANKGAGPDSPALRRAVERDRFGLMADVLTARDHRPRGLRAFRSLSDRRRSRQTWTRARL